MRHPSSLSLIASFLMLMGSGTASAVAVSGQGTWETTLQARDINGDGKTDAYYDTSTNLTWLADANLVKTSDYKFSYPGGYYPQPDYDPLPSGAISWNAALDWAYELNVGGVTGWRLPKLIDQTTTTLTEIPGIGHLLKEDHLAYLPGSSELENLFMVTLGSVQGQPLETGPFANVQAGQYWTSTQANTFHHEAAWSFSTLDLKHYAAGFANTMPPTEGYFSWAVHDGDVGQPIPEASTSAMVGLGLAAAALRAKRRKQQ